MAISTYPTASSGGIKSVQRGQAVSSGNITITSVDTTKTFVRSISEGASGTVATNSTNAAFNLTFDQAGSSSVANGLGGISQPTGGSQLANQTGLAGNTSWNFWNISKTITGATSAMSGGTTNLYTKEYGVYLSDSTTLVATGACRWEVVEFA